MTQSASQLPEELPLADIAPEERTAETFMQVTVRRSRYVVAIGVAAVLFLTLGWWVVHPPMGGTGISLAAQSGFVGAITLLALTVIATAASVPICKKDTPHAAMWCVFLGLAGLAIRGGTINELLRRHERDGTTAAFYKSLAGECLFWLAIVIAADMTARYVWKKFFHNNHWIARGGVDVGVLERGKNIGAGLPGKVIDKNPVRTALIESSLALAITGAVAYFLLPVLLQSQAKGQVLMGAFVCFGVGAGIARLFAPNADPLAFWIAVPAAAAVGYLMSASDIKFTAGQVVNDSAPGAKMLLYPGFSPTAAGRALPIDMIAGGVPGAIMGYYIALRIHVHHVLDKSRQGKEAR